jgi:hypothetical protein
MTTRPRSGVGDHYPVGVVGEIDACATESKAIYVQVKGRLESPRDAQKRNCEWRKPGRALSPVC